MGVTTQEPETQVQHSDPDPLAIAGELVRKTQEMAPEDKAPIPVDRRPRQALIPAEQPRATEMVVSMIGMSHPDDMGELFGALATAQSQFGNIERTLSAKIRSRKGEDSSFGYDYAPLDEVLNAVRPALAGQGIAVMQFPFTRQSTVVVRTMLAHQSGKAIWNDCVVSCVSTAPQDVGSAITYARRYGLQAITGVFPDSDDDGARAQGREQETRRNETTKPAAARDKESLELITACREVKQGGAVVYGIKTTTGECWTDDVNLYQQAKAAQAQEKRVLLGTEQRKSKGGTVRWLIEMSVPES